MRPICSRSVSPIWPGLLPLPFMSSVQRHIPLVLAAIGTVVVVYLGRRRARRLPLPPGLPKLPILGNLFNHPKGQPWEAYAQISKDVDSDILHFDLAGTSLVVLCSASAAADLLDKQSAAFSDRARRPMVVEVMGWDFSVAAMKYGDKWRAHRRLMHQVLNEKAAVQYRSKQLASAHEVLRRLMTTPEEFMDHFRHWAAEIIMSTTYGITIAKENDFYVDLAHAALRTLSVAGVTGTFWVDFFPALQHIPEWFPGAKFKRDGAVWRKMARQMVDASGEAPSSIVSESVRTMSDSSFYNEETVKNSAATLFLGGADTSVSALQTFVLAMLANPEAQARAQAEIDAVTQGLRLPDYDDEKNLPYVMAIVRETLRWRNATPMAIPHFTSVDGEYKGFRIPAKSLVIGNTWRVASPRTTESSLISHIRAITHDESVYPDPDKFNPDRFLLPDGQINPDVPFPDSAFGFGRRVCPGKPMALASLYIAVASILSSFKISKARDINGNEIEPTYKYLAGFISAPAPFECSILPRSDDASSLIMNTVDL
ncbi:unnamed protein product [Mycena citricolor]|uniref:Cytochrome P450 n=1 Tax=Mycena citricolor TaxID=2018698 RepID=A0AAD2HUK9_9AGAR|nr:unnamed protein product [Mycena citricolor]